MFYSRFCEHLLMFYLVFDCKGRFAVFGVVIMLGAFVGLSSCYYKAELWSLYLK